jgi:hypothetical protein
MTSLQRLESVAAQLVARIHDYDPDANARWLSAQLPDPADWFRLSFVLGAAVPTDRSWGELTAWTDWGAPVDRTVDNSATVAALMAERYPR